MLVSKEKSDYFKVLRLILKVISWIVNYIRIITDKVNTRMEGKYSPALIGITAGIIGGIISIIMLFVPPYLGMSDDGSFSKVMNSVGIYNLDDSKDSYFNYYVKTYSTVPKEPIQNSNYFSSLTILARLSLILDNIFTRDTKFDIRFMALIYILIYIPTLMIIVKQATRRVNNFSEGAVIGITGVIMFSDVSYITYFSSFYSTAIVFIFFLLCVGSVLSMQVEGNDGVWLSIYTISSLFLIFAREEYALLGIFLGVLAINLNFIKKAKVWKVSCLFLGFILFLSSVFSYYTMEPDFNLASKYHSMTRGVLLQSKDPAETLAEFGIQSNYSILTDTNVNSFYPLTNAYNKNLENGFYDKYNTSDIIFYYLKHPGSLVSMLDIAVKSAFDIRISYSGNYEKSVGLPQKAKSLFWSIWSSFKSQSAPKTVGFLFILFLGSSIIFRKTILNERSRVVAETMLLIAVVGISQTVLTIIMSGDAEFTNHIFIFSLSIDLLSYFCFAEILHKINVMQGGGKK